VAATPRDGKSFLAVITADLCWQFSGWSRAPRFANGRRPKSVGCIELNATDFVKRFFVFYW
jgi:hypothetical protein